MKNTLTEMHIMEYCDVAEDQHWVLSSKYKLKVSREKEIKAVVKHVCCMNYSHHNSINITLRGSKV